MKISREYFLIIVLSILPFIPIFITSELPHTHDGLVHLPRMAAFYKALMTGHIPVRWAGDLNYGYGMPLFNFVYHMPYIIASIFLFLGTGLVVAFKLTLLVSYLLSGVGMYLFSNALFHDKKKAFLITIFYQFATFRLIELFIRGSFGEVFTYSFLPWILYGLVQLEKTKKINYFILTAAATALLILSHNSVSLMFFGIAALFLLFIIRTWKERLMGFLSLIIGLFLSMYYWLPAIVEHKYTYGNLFMKNLYLEHFAPLYKFFIPNFINAESLQTGGISVQLGLFHIIGILLLLKFKNKEKTTKNLKIFIVFLLIITFFFMSPLSKLLWEQISLLRQFQFPWRFLAVAVFSTSLAAVGYFYLDIIKRRSVYILLIVLTILSSVWYWNPSLGFDKVDEEYYWNFPLNTTYYGETDVIWSAGPAKTYPKDRIEIIGGKGKIENFKKQNHIQTFTIHADTNVSLVSNTQYFPGWEVYINDKTKTDIQFQDPNHRGEIVFSVPKGIHTVKLIFSETKLRLVTNITSFLTAFLLFVLFVYYSSRGRLKTK